MASPLPPESSSRIPEVPLVHAVLSPDAPPPVGAYSPAIFSEGWLFLSGQVGVEPESGKPVEGIEAQTELALDNLERLLEAGGSSLSRVVSMSCMLSDMRQFERFDAVYRRRFDTPYPARASFGVQLGEGFLVEILAIARCGSRDG